MAVKTGNFVVKLSLDGEENLFVTLTVKPPYGDNCKLFILYHPPNCTLISPTQEAYAKFTEKKIWIGQQINLPIEDYLFANPDYRKKWDGFIIPKSKTIEFEIVFPTCTF